MKPCKPITFKGFEVRATQDGRKSQFRLPVHRLRRFGVVTEFGPSDTKGYDWHFRDKRKHWNDLRHEELLTYLPYTVGQQLWVREKLRATGNNQVVYDADDSVHPDAEWVWKNWTLPSIHCPRGLSRITLEVTAVNVEWLQGISAHDVVHEGLPIHVDEATFVKVYKDPVERADERRKCFRDLWNSIHGESAWDANPFVAAYSFRSVG